MWLASKRTGKVRQVGAVLRHGQRGTIFRVLRPFVAYLRVYEPLSAFEPELAAKLRERSESTPLARTDAGIREQQLWFQSQLAMPPRLLPGELANGKASPNAPLDVLVLDSTETPQSDSAMVGPAPLVCPLDLRPRAAAALSGFIATTSGPLRAAALIQSVERARAHASRAMSEIAHGTAHVISSTWTVPLPWFSLVEPAERRMVLGEQNDHERQVSWRVPMAEARQRAARAYAVTKEAFGERGPTLMLHDTEHWLARFDPHSVVELDYGGLVQLLDNETLRGDTSVADVHAILDAIEAGNPDEVTSHYERLRKFWSALLAREQLN